MDLSDKGDLDRTVTEHKTLTAINLYKYARAYWRKASDLPDTTWDWRAYTCWRGSGLARLRPALEKSVETAIAGAKTLAYDRKRSDSQSKECEVSSRTTQFWADCER